MFRTTAARSVAALAEHQFPLRARRPLGAGRLRIAFARIRRLVREPETLLAALGVESHPLVCAACGEPVSPTADVVYSERYDGLVDPNCSMIPAWVRLENHAVRLLWLRTPSAAGHHVEPAPFSFESAVRGL